MIKILFVCSKNQWRSPTAERIYRNDVRLQVRSAGVNSSAKHQISIKDIEWCDLILVMEYRHKECIRKKFNKMKLPNISRVPSLK
ncbi:MAG: hypothetical protein GX639_19595 [Fibrobacter sp.]|nr:hypothetical protein [Fibrobacter sp.]